MDQYKLQHEKGSGTFSVVFTALSLKSGKYVAIKCMKKKFDSLQKVKKLKEIQALNILAGHQNVIKMIEALYDQPSGKLALVFQLMDMNLYEALKKKKNPLTYQKIKFYMFQVLRALQFMHRKGIFHRDIKPQNILIKGNLVKVADLGSCKGKHSPAPYTDYISTRWYRAPQCLMTDGYYNQKMDIWGFGCVLFQLITKKPLFPGKDQLDQIHRIHNVVGTPKQQVLDRFKSQASHMQINFPAKKGLGLDKLLPSGCPNDLKDILTKLLSYDPNQRITSQQALKHDYFSQYANQVQNLGNLNPKDFRSTFFTMKQSNGSYTKQKSQQAQAQGKKKTLSKHNKNYGSKHNLQKPQQDGYLPKIAVNSNISNLMQNYKKTFYSKNFSNDFNFGIIQGKKAH